jgi:hypothetical protein
LFHDIAGRQDNQWVAHDPPRKWGVPKAIRKSKILKEQFELVFESRAHNGIGVWKKHALV